MRKFKMIIECEWCSNEIEIDPLPVVFDSMTLSYAIDSDRQKELIERHGWITYGGTFCSNNCRSEYLDEKNIEDFGDGEDENEGD